MNDREHIRDIKEEYKTPPVPTGFAHVKGEWDDGFVIRQIKDAFESESEFVWIPVCLLDADGTLDGQNFQEQFGARNYRYSGLPSRNVRRGRLRCYGCRDKTLIYRILTPSRRF